MGGGLVQHTVSIQVGGGLVQHIVSIQVGVQIIDVYILSIDTQNRLESWQKVLTDNGLKINEQKQNICQQGKIRCQSN